MPYWTQTYVQAPKLIFTVHGEALFCKAISIHNADHENTHKNRARNAP